MKRAYTSLLLLILLLGALVASHGLKVKNDDDGMCFPCVLGLFLIQGGCVYVCVCVCVCE